jgi:hypothetical protein
MRNLLQAAIFLMIGLSLNACDVYDDCFTPPAPVYFKLYSDSKQDLLASDTFELRFLKIVDATRDQLIQKDTFSIDGAYYLTAESIGWQEGVNNYLFTYNDNELFTFSIQANQISENCCTYTVYEDVSISGSAFEEVNMTNLGTVYRVKISL